jgi:hypothetical protein
MDEYEFTPWFPGHVDPAYPGIYNVSCRDVEQTGTWYGRFNGTAWHGSWDTDVDGELLQPGHRPWRKDGRPKSWRGLAHPPKGDV